MNIGGRRSTYTYNFYIYYDNVVSASSLAKMKRSIVSIIILCFLISSTAAVKKLPEHLFVNRIQEKTHSVEEDGVETEVTTIKVFWSLYEGGYVFGKKRLIGKRENGKYR